MGAVGRFFEQAALPIVRTLASFAAFNIVSLYLATTTYKNVAESCRSRMASMRTKYLVLKSRVSIPCAIGIYKKVSHGLGSDKGTSQKSVREKGKGDVVIGESNALLLISSSFDVNVY